MQNPSEAKSLLLDERRRLTSLLDSFIDDHTAASSIGELADYDQHQADAATETFEQWREVGLRNTIQREIAEVDAALKRLEEGAFGICEDCHAPIDDERIRAVPFARFCRDHQPGGEVMTTWHRKRDDT